MLPNMLKPTVVVGAVEFEGAWPKAGPPGTLVVAVTVAGGGFPNWKTGPGVAKPVSVLGAELAGPPNRKGCDVLVDVAAVTVRLAVGPVEAGGLSPKLKTGLMVASVEELCVVAVVAAVVKMTLGRPVNPARVVVEAAGRSAAEAGCDVGLKAKGEAFAGDEAAVTLPKIGLNMVVVEDVEEAPELADTVTVVETTAVQGAVLSLFGKAPKMGLKTGVVVGTAVVVVGTAAAVVVAGWLAGGVFGIPKRMLGFGKEGGLLGVWPSSVNAGGARLLGACTPKAAGAVGAGVLDTGTGLVSAEVAGRELDSSDTAGAGGCAADEGGWDATAAPVESGKRERAYLGTGGHLHPASPSARHPPCCCKGSRSSTRPYQTDPALHAYRSAEQDHGLSVPKLAPSPDLPASSAASRAFERGVFVTCLPQSQRRAPTAPAWLYQSPALPTLLLLTCWCGRSLAALHLLQAVQERVGAGWGRSCRGRRRPRGGHGERQRPGHGRSLCSGAGDRIYWEEARNQDPQLAVGDDPLADLPHRVGKLHEHPTAPALGNLTHRPGDSGARALLSLKAPRASPDPRTRQDWPRSSPSLCYTDTPLPC